MDEQLASSKLLELDFQENNYIRAYHRLFSGFNHDADIYLTRVDFANGHTLYAFDLSPDMCDRYLLNYTASRIHTYWNKISWSLRKKDDYIDLCWIWKHYWNEQIASRDMRLSKVMWMNSLQIENILSHEAVTWKYFLGVFKSD